jgi:hypothetical protein
LTEQDVKLFVDTLGVLVDECGANINQRTREGLRLPINYIARSGCLRALQAMLSRGADIHLRDEEGWTSLLCLCMSDVTNPHTPDRVACLHAMIEANADVNATNLNGTSAMLAASTYEVLNVELMEALLAAGADASLRTKAGDSAASFLHRSLEHDQGQQHDALARMLELVTAASGDGAKDEVQAVKFIKLLDSFVPIYNANVTEEDTRIQSDPALKRAMRERLLRNVPTEEDLMSYRRCRGQSGAVLKAIMRHFEMDDSVLERRMLGTDTNWLEELHRRVMAMIPKQFITFYHSPPSDDVVQLFAVNDGEAREKAKVVQGTIRTTDMAKLRSHVTMRYRNRGFVSKMMMVESPRKCILKPWEELIGFAVPNEDALLTLADHAPIVEAGAGTGYWSAVLQHRGVDIVAYDAFPPGDDLKNGFFWNQTYTEVLKGAGETLCTENPELARRTLLMVWPNNPDSVDNPDLGDSDDHKLWDADCLRAFLDAGGSKVIYVGERESQVQVAPGSPSDSGITGSRRFQRMLRDHFTLVQEVSIPRLPFNFDDLTVWVKK